MSLLGNAQAILGALGAFIVAALVAFFGGRVSGANREREKQAAKDAKAYENHLNDLGRAADAANRLPDPANDIHNRDARR